MKISKQNMRNIFFMMMGFAFAMSVEASASTCDTYLIKADNNIIESEKIGDNAYGLRSMMYMERYHICVKRENNKIMYDSVQRSLGISNNSLQEATGYSKGTSNDSFQEAIGYSKE